MQRPRFVIFAALVPLVELVLAAADSCTGTREEHYRLDFHAEGRNFFDGFDFDTHNPTGGVADYMPWDAAWAEGVIEFDWRNSTILRTGGRAWNGRRKSVRVTTKRRWKYFLSAMKFNHMPFGSGVWPAFWSNGPGEWPNGGELDVLEYANAEAMKISLHTGQENRCRLHPDAVNKCNAFPDRNNMNYDCDTAYTMENPKLGCAPTSGAANKRGEDWRHTPGVVITEWTEDFVKVFFIPEWEIPTDLQEGQPRPSEWDQWMVSYFPFAESERLAPGSCPDPANIMDAQKLILNIELCGDWAGYTWEAAPDGPNFWDWNSRVWQNRCKKQHWASGEDCCAQWMASPDSDEYLRKRAFFDISWIKIWTPTASKGEVAATSDNITII